MVRMVIDSSFLQSDALRAYLSASPANYAILTEYAAVEAYKQDALDSIYKRMEILIEFPRQVTVLKPTIVVCGLSGRDAASAESLIDEEQTRDFSEFCRHLLAAKHGDLSRQRDILAHGRAAAAQTNRMLLGSPILASGIDLVAKTYTPAELKILRRRESATPQMQRKLMNNVLMLAAQLFKEHPSVTKQPGAPHVRNTFIFRFALCAYVLILSRIKDGSAEGVSPEKLRNDMVDVNFATFATYFDGLLTADRRAAETYAGAEFLLREAFAVPPWWRRALLWLTNLG